MTLAAALLVVSLAPWPDPFHPSFASGIAARENEPIEFRPAPARGWVDAVRRMAADAPAKEQYVLFLKETYGYNIASLNKAYGIEAGSFTELLTYDYRQLDTARPAIRADDGRFLKLLTQAAIDAIRPSR